MTPSRGIYAPRKRFTPEDVELIRQLRDDGCSVAEIANMLECSEKAIRTRVAAERVPVAPLREAFERSGLTATEVARRLDWYQHSRPDGYRVKRALGIKPSPLSHGYGYKCIEATSYERALKLADAIGVDPVDVEL